MNFFLFKRDRDFFNTNIRTYILNKLEKSFVDLYLLAVDGKNAYTEKVLAYLEFSDMINTLNILEKCLLVETALKHGTDSQKTKARNYAKLIMQTNERNFERVGHLQFDQLIEMYLNAIDTNDNNLLDLGQFDLMTAPVSEPIFDLMSLNMASNNVPSTTNNTFTVKAGKHGKQKEIRFDSGMVTDMVTQAKCVELETTKEYDETHYY